MKQMKLETNVKTNIHKNYFEKVKKKKDSFLYFKIISLVSYYRQRAFTVSAILCVKMFYMSYK